MIFVKCSGHFLWEKKINFGWESCTWFNITSFIISLYDFSVCIALPRWRLFLPSAKFSLIVCSYCSHSNHLRMVALLAISTSDWVSVPWTIGNEANPSPSPISTNTDIHLVPSIQVYSISNVLSTDMGYPCFPSLPISDYHTSNNSPHSQ